MIDRDGIERADPRDLIAREWRIRDEDLAAMPEISRHDKPQDSPQEYECGCVAVTRITDRDARRGERPFEMRLALPCGTASCEVKITARKEKRTGNLNRMIAEAKKDDAALRGQSTILLDALSGLLTNLGDEAGALYAASLARLLGDKKRRSARKPGGS